MKDKPKNDWKRRDGVVFSTDPEFAYSSTPSAEEDTLPPNQQMLRVILDTSGRAGKKVTLVTGFVGKATDLDELSKILRTKCGVGGSAKAAEIILQGDVRDKAVQILQKDGYKVRRIG